MKKFEVKLNFVDYLFPEPFNQRMKEFHTELYSRFRNEIGLSSEECSKTSKIAHDLAILYFLVDKPGLGKQDTIAGLSEALLSVEGDHEEAMDHDSPELEFQRHLRSVTALNTRINATQTLVSLKSRLIAIEEYKNLFGFPVVNNLTLEQKVINDETIASAKKEIMDDALKLSEICYGDEIDRLLIELS